MLAALMLLWQGVVHLPIGHIRYCVEYHDPGCIKQTITPTDLAYINKAIVEWMTPRDNPDPGQRWEAFKQDGDCENHVASVRQALLAFGLDPKAMHFEAGEITESGKVSQHVVLVVRLNGKDWVADMKTPDFLYTPNDRPYPWKPVTSETSNVLWSDK